MKAVAALLTVLCLASAASAEELAETCARFAGHDVDGDGHAELESLTPLEAPEGEGQLVLVLVEDRLLEDLGSEHDLRPVLQTYAEDLLADGFRPRLISARLSRSARHQDGRQLLALRRFLQTVRTHDETLAGVVLVGAFPDAFLVRTCNWIKHNPLTLNRGKPGAKTFKQRTWHLRTFPEPIARRADIVLADLDGDWEPRYVEARKTLPTYMGVFPAGVPNEGGVAVDYEVGGRTFEDFFLVDDGKLDVAVVESGLSMVPRWGETDGECSAADRVRNNPLARPEINVSRINARGVALSPRRDVRGVEGRGLLDEQGRPQPVRFASKKQVPHWAGVWAHDPHLERQLLREYFARNHRFRRGHVAHPTFKPASVSHGLPSGMRKVRRGHADWKGFKQQGYDVPQANLAQLVAWLREPAALRTFRAHSDAWGSVFGRADMKALHAAVGTPWSWTRRGAELVPSLSAACRRGRADFFLYRSLWANGLRPAPSLMIHTGCNGVSPTGAKKRAWHDPNYELRQGAASFLFYAGGLALVGRAKVFYDEPRGFSQELAKGRTFGDAWRHYYAVESRGPTFGKVGGRIGRKRSYFWSVLGDWTLRLKEPVRFY